MFKTPQKRSGGSSIYGTPKKVPLNGLFSDGVWHCNCDPHLPATKFQVRKEGPNTGRWFYTCQEPKGSGCGFFLWNDQAVGRERGTLLSNSRSEPDPLRTPSDASRNRKTLQGHDAGSNKCMEGLKREEEDEFGDWPLTPEDEENVTKRVEKAMPGAFPETPETPRKAVKFSEDVTPGSKRKRDVGEMLPTPRSTGRKDEDIFTTPATSKRFDGGMWDGNEFATPDNVTTPTPFRFHNPPSPSKDTEGSETTPSRNYDITAEVMELLLKDTYISSETQTKLKDLLNKHALKISGIAKGRDITRVALRSKDLKIAELQQKIGQMEQEREMDKAIIKRFKSDIADSVTRKARGRNNFNK